MHTDAALAPLPSPPHPTLPRLPQYVPIDEAHPLKAVSPYGATKLMIEDILRDVSASDPEWRVALLRYFNPVGAHPSGAYVVCSGRGAKHPAVRVSMCCGVGGRAAPGAGRDLGGCPACGGGLQRKTRRRRLCPTARITRSTGRHPCRASPSPRSHPPTLHRRQDWGAPGDAEQPDAVGAGGGAGPPPRAQRVRHRLRHARRHLRARLHPRHGPGWVGRARAMLLCCAVPRRRAGWPARKRAALCVRRAGVPMLRPGARPCPPTPIIAPNLLPAPLRSRPPALPARRGPRGGGEEGAGQPPAALRAVQPGHRHRHHGAGDGAPGGLAEDGARGAGGAPLGGLPGCRPRDCKHARPVSTASAPLPPLLHCRCRRTHSLPPQVHAFEEASGLKVNLNLTGRRPGDATAVWAATDTAEKELGWKAKLTVKEMCRDQWAWVRGWAGCWAGRGAGPHARRASALPGACCAGLWCGAVRAAGCWWVLRARLDCPARAGPARPSRLRCSLTPGLPCCTAVLECPAGEPEPCGLPDGRQRGAAEGGQGEGAAVRTELRPPQRPPAAHPHHPPACLASLAFAAAAPPSAALLLRRASAGLLTRGRPQPLSAVRCPVFAQHCWYCKRQPLQAKRLLLLLHTWLSCACAHGALTPGCPGGRQGCRTPAAWASAG